MKLNKALTGALVAASMGMSSIATAADVVIGVPNWPVSGFQSSKTALFPY